MENWIRILVATGFNLLFEYSLRGINDLAVRPLLPLFLLLVYFPYFTLLEYFIERYHLKDWQVLVAGFIFGSFAAFFIPGGMFTGQLLLGVNWGSFFFITVVWWGNLQGVLTFYLARIVVPERKRQVFITKLGLGILFGLLVAMLWVFRIAIRNAPPITPVGALLILGIAFSALLLLYQTRNRKPKPDAGRCVVLDAVVGLTVGLFAISAVFFTDKAALEIHMVNLTAVKVIVPWSIIAFCITWGYRVFSKREIQV
ncbi:MAG: hypothetical protein N3F63_04485 [Thermoplasmata archaeon]|nr:hypothetical protein [Thermoplasmata archaeon]